MAAGSSASGAEGYRFESCRAHHETGPISAIFPPVSARSGPRALRPVPVRIPKPPGLTVQNPASQSANI
jgi:hypothetical protein